MPKITANHVTINYEQQGSGEPLVLIPYLTADHACYGFQVAEYAKHFTCFSVDLRGTGESSTATGAYSTEDLADDIAGFMQAAGLQRAHVAGLSLGAAIGMWLAAKHPDKVQSLSLRAAWPKTDAFMRPVVESWRTMAEALGSVHAMAIAGIFPWCFTPELYAARPEYIQALADFVRSRPEQSVAAFMQQSDAALGHDADGRLGAITAPTLLTFGRTDRLTSTRFADRLKSGIRNSELLIFEGCAHAPLYEHVDEFNERTLEFLLRHAGAGV